MNYLVNEPSKPIVIKAQKVLRDEDGKKLRSNRISKSKLNYSAAANMKRNNAFEKIRFKYNDKDDECAILTEIRSVEKSMDKNDFKDSIYSNVKILRDDKNLGVDIIEYELSTHKILNNGNLIDYEKSSTTSKNINNNKETSIISFDNLSENIEFSVKAENIEISVKAADSKLIDNVNTFRKTNEKSFRNNDKHATNFRCHICNKTYKFVKSFQSHIKLHEYFNTRKAVKSKNITVDNCKFKDVWQKETIDDVQCNRSLNVKKKNDLKNGLKDDKLIIQSKIVCVSEEKISDLQCKICGKLYTRISNLRKHLTIHGPDGCLIHTCRICNKYFTTKEEVSTHTMNEHKDQITCNICKKIYKDAELLQAHRRYSHADSFLGKPKKYTFICNKCGRTLSSRTALTNHELSDCGKSPIHKCNVCGKGLHSAGSLKSHMLVHSGELEFKCKFCDKGFARKGQCQIHERKHTGEKPFPCTYCDKAFAYRENLLIHISTHTGLKRYVCNSCGERFSCVTGLKAHWRTHATTCGSDPNRSTKAAGFYLGFQKGQLVHTKEPI